jgi:hypothetical protein
MSDIFRTIVVTAADAELARNLAAISPGGDDMFITALSANGQAPASHYISTGLLPAAFVAPLPLQTWVPISDTWMLVGEEPGDAQAVYDAALAAGLSVSESQIVTLFGDSDVTVQEPFVAMGRLGLQIIDYPESA